MVTLTLEIDQEKDLPVLEALFNRMDLKYHIDDDDESDLSEAELEGINAGLADIAAGRVHTQEEAKRRLEQKLQSLRNGK